jgi:hypothetical protein
MKIIIVLSGPPSCGKDTAASAFNRWYHCCEHLEMKRQLFKIAKSIIPFSEKEWDERYECPTLKSQPWDKLGGLSQRQFMIKISEEWCKPIFGKDYFGHMAVKSVIDTDNDIPWTTNTFYFFSDGGFMEEIECLKEVKDSKLIVIRIHREGKSFAGDSRNYLYLPGSDADVVNDGTPDDLCYKIHQKVEELSGIKFGDHNFWLRDKTGLVPVEA